MNNLKPKKMLKKEIYEQIELILKEEGVPFQKFLDILFDYLDKDDCQGLLDHLIDELHIR
jgi:hypothetical protein